MPPLWRLVCGIPLPNLARHINLCPWACPTAHKGASLPSDVSGYQHIPRLVSRRARDESAAFMDVLCSRVNALLFRSSMGLVEMNQKLVLVGSAAHTKKSIVALPLGSRGQSLMSATVWLHSMKTRRYYGICVGLSL